MKRITGLDWPLLALAGCLLALYKRWDWRLPIGFVVTIIALYLPYIDVGTKVFGFLGSYISEEGLDRGAGIFLWQLVVAIAAPPQQAFAFYMACAATVMAALALFVVMRAQKPGADFAGAWYFAWLVLFLCFYPVVGVVYLTLASSGLYFAHWQPTVAEALPIYGPCILLLIAEFAFRRRKMEERHADPA